MMLRSLVLGALAVMTLGAAPVEAAEEAPRRLVVTGNGEASGRPDLARISTGVVVQADTASAALAENTRAMSAVLDQLAASGVAEADVQTSQFAVTPLYERVERAQQSQPPRIVGYQVSNQVTVQVRDLDRLGATLDALVGAGANQLNGLSFEIADPKPLLEQARDAAVADARAKAERYATAAGVTLGRVLSIEEGGVHVPRPMMRAAEAMAASAVPIAPGESEISASVTMVFAIE